jgi:hypothetical protein
MSNDGSFIPKSAMPGAPLSEVLAANRELGMLVQRRDEAFTAWLQMLIDKGWDPNTLNFDQVPGPLYGLSPFVTLYFALPKKRYPTVESRDRFLMDGQAHRIAIKRRHVAQLIFDASARVKSGSIDPVMQQDNRRDEDKHALVAPKARKQKGRIF